MPSEKDIITKYGEIRRLKLQSFDLELIAAFFFCSFVGTRRARLVNRQGSRSINAQGIYREVPYAGCRDRVPGPLGRACRDPLGHGDHGLVTVPEQAVHRHMGEAPGGGESMSACPIGCLCHPSIQSYIDAVSTERIPP